MQLILLNGPPRSGKDTAAKHISRCFNATHLKHSTLLQEALQLLFTIPRDYWADNYELRKDEPWDQLGGLSPRRAMIWLSEEVLKPKFGEDFLGRALARRIQALGHPLYVISDCGFQPEQDPLLQVAKPGNCLLLRVHREGHTFDEDSRSYIDLPCLSHDVANHGNLPQFHDQLYSLVKDFLGARARSQPCPSASTNVQRPPTGTYAKHIEESAFREALENASARPPRT